jgi:hypothetical protein
MRAHISRQLRVAGALAILATLTATPAWGQDSLLWGGSSPVRTRSDTGSWQSTSATLLPQVKGGSNG